MRRCCLIHLKNNSICQRDLYSAAIVVAGNGKSLVRNTNRLSLFVVVANATQRLRDSLERVVGFQDDRLIALDAGRFVDLVRIATLEFEIAFGAGDEERLGLMQVVESLEVEIAAIHDVIGAGYRNQMVQDVDIVQFSVGNQDEFGNVALEIQQRMQFDRPFGSAKLRPGKQRQTEVDGGGVQGVNRGVEIEPEVFVGVDVIVPGMRI